MATKSNIQWTDASWNIARGCTKVDADCKFCYMYRESLNGTRYEPKSVTRTKTVFNLPLKIKEPSKIFTSSLTDFFHEDIDAFRHEAWDIIRKCPQHTFQILTKRPERMMSHIPEHFKNVWLGTSVGSDDSLVRLVQLIRSPWSGIRFVSFEPMHGPISLESALWMHALGFRQPVVGWKHYDINNGNLGLDWVIVGGESGNDKGMYRYRECKIEWFERIIYDCRRNSIPVFVKQLGTHLAKQLKLSDRHGGNMEEWPEHLKIREFPKEKNYAR
jgi:protein gp37